MNCIHWKRSFVYKDQKYDLFEYETQRSYSETSFRIIHQVTVKLGIDKKILNVCYFGWGTYEGHTDSLCSMQVSEDIGSDVQNFCDAGQIDMPDNCKISQLI
jgi:hypothetical protein